MAGAWFVAAGISTLRQYHDLVPQAARLFAADVGATDAPIRALLAMILAVALVPIGLLLAVKGWRWMRRLPLPAEGPAAIDRDEVVATLRRGQLLAYADGAWEVYWPLRRWLADDLADMTGWRREIVSRAVRTLVRSCTFVLALAACLVLVEITTDQLFGPFPLGFVVLLPFVTAVSAVFSLLLIGSNGPRIESVEFPLPVRADTRRELAADEIIESPPRMLTSESPALAITLGVTGVAVQCLLLWWWNLSYVGYPHMVTSIVRDAGSVAGGIVFLGLGDRMAATAAELLLRLRYDSILVLLDKVGDGMVARAAAVRSESRGPVGPRQVLSAVGGSYARESAERLIDEQTSSVSRAG